MEGHSGPEITHEAYTVDTRNSDACHALGSERLREQVLEVPANTLHAPVGLTDAASLVKHIFCIVSTR